MDEAHLHHAFRYVSLNPVRAGLVERAQDWNWSSVRCHIEGVDEGAFKALPALERVGRFEEFLAIPFDEDQAYRGLRAQETVGRPLGDAKWLEKLECQTGMTLAPGKRGPKPKSFD
jgi:putative transposase